MVSEDAPPFVIAEAGINHEGSLEKAFELVDAAVAAGAECIKFQCHIAEKEMLHTDITPVGISAEPVWDIIKRCELTADEELKLQAYCAEQGIMFLSTPFSREAADRLDSMGVPAFKVGSGECNNLPLVRHIARLGKPVILSTGMNDMASVQRSVAVLREVGTPFALLHCTSMYPTPYNKVRLGAIAELREAFDAPIGLSDHSLGIYTSIAAVALGACILEKHFTISRSWPGPDTGMSIEPGELEELVKGSKAVWEARGGDSAILPEEKPVIDFAYSSVVTIRPVKAGDVFSQDNLWVKRPGSGPIDAANYDAILGARASTDIPEDSFLLPEQILR
jgi:N-acetylneuraminate synthase